VIHGISFDIKAKEKIGIIGRTGSGKSTMTLGLLRILELSTDENGHKGSIILDGLNIEDVGLECKYYFFIN
jgi:ABC-type multidrug transport system fused ATPase/permease subunit